MAEQYEVVAICKSHTEAEAAVKELQHSGIDTKKLSIVGRDDHTDENMVGYHNGGDLMKYWSKTGAFCGEIWGMLKQSFVQSETALKTNKCAGPGPGSAEEADHAQKIISRTTPESVEKHQPSRINSEPHSARA